VPSLLVLITQFISMTIILITMFLRVDHVHILPSRKNKHARLRLWSFLNTSTLRKNKQNKTTKGKSSSLTYRKSCLQAQDMSFQQFEFYQCFIENEIAWILTTNYAHHLSIAGSRSTFSMDNRSQL
jgi:hypothetical protein